MSEARGAIFARLRTALKREPESQRAAETEVARRLGRPTANLVPARGQLDREARIELFMSQARVVQADVERLPSFDEVPAAVKKRRQAGLMRLQRRLVERAQRLRIGSQVRILVDGPSAEHDLVLRGRMQGQAPEIDPQVYLTDCDPSELAPGQFIQAEVVGNRAYDLVVRPRLR